MLARTRITRRLPHGRHVCYCTRAPRNDRSGHARSLHVGTPVHVCTVYGRPGNNPRGKQSQVPEQARTKRIHRKTSRIWSPHASCCITQYRVRTNHRKVHCARARGTPRNAQPRNHAVMPTTKQHQRIQQPHASSTAHPSTGNRGTIHNVG